MEGFRRLVFKMTEYAYPLLCLCRVKLAQCTSVRDTNLPVPYLHIQYVRSFVCAHVCTYTRMCTCVYVIRMCVCAHVRTYVRMCTCAYIHMYVRMCMCVHTYVRMGVCAHVRTYICSAVLLCGYIFSRPL